VSVRSKWGGIPGTTRDDKAELVAEAGKAYYVRIRYKTNRPKHLLPGGALQFEDRDGLEVVEEKEAAPQMAGMAAAEGFGAAGIR
jgi:hypothetical protein